MQLTPQAQAFDLEFLSDLEASIGRMEQRISSFFSSDIDTTLNQAQGHIDKMREHFDNMQEHIVQKYEALTNTTQEKSTNTPLLTIKDEDTLVRITVQIGDVETDMIENHLENNTLVITIPKNNPTLRITIYPNTVIVTGNKTVEKEQKNEDDKKPSSRIVSSRQIHLEQTLPATVITTENVNIVHSADNKTLTIELPKKVHKQKFSIKKQ